MFDNASSLAAPASITSSSSTPFKRELDLLDVIQHLCGHPGYRLTTLKTIPQVTHSSTGDHHLMFLLRHSRSNPFGDCAPISGIFTSQGLYLAELVVLDEASSANANCRLCHGRRHRLESQTYRFFKTFQTLHAIFSDRLMVGVCIVFAGR
jgi:hypothetical protein